MDEDDVRPVLERAVAAPSTKQKLGKYETMLKTQQPNLKAPTTTGVFGYMERGFSQGVPHNMLRQEEAAAYRLEWATKELETFRLEKVKTTSWRRSTARMAVASCWSSYLDGGG